MKYCVQVTVIMIICMGVLTTRLLKTATDGIGIVVLHMLVLALEDQHAIRALARKCRKPFCERSLGRGRGQRIDAQRGSAQLKVDRVARGASGSWYFAFAI